MTDNLRESISALMDDEANELELRRVIAEMDNGDEVRSTWKRYQTASSAMKRQLNAHSNIDISSQVSAAIADITPDQEDEQTKVTPVTRITKHLTSLAVAASVAFMVVFGVSQFNDLESGNVDNAVAIEKAPQNTNLAANSLDGSAVLPASAELTPSQKRLRMLMERHVHQADMSRGSGVMPNVQLVSQKRSQD